MTSTFVHTHLLLLLHTYLAKMRNGKNNLQQNSLTIVDLMICVIVKFILPQVCNLTSASVSSSSY